MKKITTILTIVFIVPFLVCSAQTSSNELSILTIRHFTNAPISVLFGEDFYPESTNKFRQTDIPTGQYQLQVFLHENVVDNYGNAKNIRTLVFDGNIDIQANVEVHAMVGRDQTLVIEKTTSLLAENTSNEETINVFDY